MGMFFTVFFAVLSAMLCARVIEWVIIAAVKTHQEQKNKADAYDKTMRGQ